MAKPTGKEMVAIFKEEKDAIALANQMDNFVNNFSADTEGFVEAMKVEDEETKIRFATISLFWVKKLNDYLEKDWYDLRNKYSVETCQQISKFLGEDLQSFYPEYTGHLDPYYNEEEEAEEWKIEFEVNFVEKMARTHRTLQQTFSEIVFHWLTVMNESMENEFFIKVSKKIEENLEKGFHRTPMI
ncbi:hypothetical protein CVD28_00960 [Bacillus sp. M6-12]|uniref:hypothetical protein n=1 Tax=Bacillus sp. M6-12 TaxID=2054166 RepID=UPI000C767DC0|nr:hypothetical protein [Bacillus sp. M6-12]PLS19003.1 hypothetical protein CVD28_00960 [Bacillus sp. M6-12]